MSEQITNPFDPFFDKIREIIREEIKAALNGNGHATESTQLLKLKDAAKRLNQSDSWVYRRWKELGGKKQGGNIRFAAADIEKFIAKRGA
jgi:predicted DNA-binding transcriptional regulator AlpA